MPLTRCQVDGVDGWKWGDQGKCYTGPGSKQKAIKQGVAAGGGTLEEGASEVKKCTLIETCFSESLKIDKDNAVIRNVRILGRVSKNNREYTEAAMDQAAALYEDIRVNVDHPRKRGEANERGIAEGFGVIKNSHHRHGQGVYGDLHYLKTHPLAEMIVERAERMPHTFGLSHNADGAVSHRDGKMIIESVERVKSVDLVDEPATNAGLFESIEEEQKTVKTTFKKILEEHGPKSKHTAAVTLLREQMEASPDVGALPIDVAPESSAEDQVKSAFKAMVMAVLDDDKLDTQSAIAKIKEILKAKEKLQGGSEKPGDGGGEAKGGPEKTKESVQQQTDSTVTWLKEQVSRIERRDMARDILESHGLVLADLDADRRKTLLEMVTEESMQTLIKSWPPVVFAKIGRGYGKPAISPLRESNEGFASAPKTREEIFERLK